MKRGKPLRRRTPLRAKTGLKRGKPLERRTPLAKRSPKQAAKVAGWARIKARRIKAQMDARGFTWCERCGKATKWLELHHTKYAGRGGAWTEDNAELICTGPDSCHDTEHGKPWPDKGGHRGDS